MIKGDYYLFWRHQFGQWTLRNIIDLDGITYNCCEQYMMYKKAKLFCDNITAQKILDEEDPALQQKLGKKVVGFTKEVWNQYKVAIVWQANYLKFTQHDDLQKRLLETDNHILVEASPYDRIWGVGLGADDEAIIDESQWRGENLLGKVLTSVRDLLQSTHIE